MGDKFKDRVDVPFLEQVICTFRESEGFDGDKLYGHDYPGTRYNSPALLFISLMMVLRDIAASPLFNLLDGKLACGQLLHLS